MEWEVLTELVLLERFKFLCWIVLVSILVV